MNILEAIKDMDPATIKNIGWLLASAIGTILLVCTLFVAAVSLAWKVIKGFAKVIKMLLCTAIFLGIGCLFTVAPPPVEEPEEIIYTVVDEV